MRRSAGSSARCWRRQQSKLRRLGAERALHDRPADQRPIRWRINQAPVPVGHFQHRRSHSVPYIRHHAEPAPPGQWRRHRHHHVVGCDRERYDLVDARRDMATRPPRVVRGRLVARLQQRGGDQHQRPVRHLPLGLGLLDVAGLQRRHRPDRVLRLILDPRYGATVARRSVRLPASMGRGACAHGQCATRHAPLDRNGRGHLPDGVASNGPLASASCRVIGPTACTPTRFGWSTARCGSRLRTSESRKACARVSGKPLGARGQPDQPAAPRVLARGADSCPDRGAQAVQPRHPAPA